MERLFISERTKSELAQRKTIGIKLLRKKSVLGKSKDDTHKDKIQELLNYGVPL